MAMLKVSGEVKLSFDAEVPARGPKAKAKASVYAGGKGATAKYLRLTLVSWDGDEVLSAAKKGDILDIEGDLANGAWVDKEGRERDDLTVYVRSCRAVGGREVATTEPSGDEMPF